MFSEFTCTEAVPWQFITDKRRYQISDKAVSYLKFDKISRALLIISASIYERLKPPDGIPPRREQQKMEQRRLFKICE